MKLISCRYRERTYIGLLDGERVALPALSPDWDNRFPDMLSLIDSGSDGLRAFSGFIADAGEDVVVALADVHLTAPIPRPRQNVICMGWNYDDHLQETKKGDAGDDRPKHPIVFTKAASCVTGPFDDVPHDPEISDKVDWEVELGVVIGRAGHKVDVADALDYVFGYMVINDVTARELQKRHKQFYLGKSLPNSCPTGPAIVTADEIPDPQALSLKCRVNGEVKQDASTASQIFDVATVISCVSRSPGIEPGDVIATGTPSGVGYVRNPPEYLRPGDVVECEVEKIGCIRNRIVEAKA